MPSDTVLDKTLAEEIYKQNLELLEQRRRTEQLLYSVSEAVLAVDTNLRITIFNKAAERIFKVASTDVLDKNIDEVVMLETEKGERIFAKDYCFQSDSNKSILSSVVLKTETRGYYVNLKSSVIDQTKSQKECLVTITDVTKEVELDKTKDDFISVTSHELRTPITIIKSYLWMLANEKGGPLNVKQKEYIEKAIRGSERLLNLINDTLNISRMENGKVEFIIEEIDLKTFLGDISSDLKIKTDEKGLQLNVQLAADLKNIYADKNKLREVVTNFFGNSFKFTQNGNITIKAENTNNGLVKVQITDTGKGISRDDLKRLFLKFGRLDNSYQTVAETAGTGLGLYIVKKYVEEMGGSVGADSEGEGKGSTFWFTLPTYNIKTSVPINSNNPQTIESLMAQNTSSITTIAPNQ